MNTKVCGITQLKQLQQLDGLDIDFAGLIFYKDSPRYVGDKINKDDLKNSYFDLKKVRSTRSVGAVGLIGVSAPGPVAELGELAGSVVV